MQLAARLSAESAARARTAEPHSLADSKKNGRKYFTRIISRLRPLEIVHSRLSLQAQRDAGWKWKLQILTRDFEKCGNGRRGHLLCPAGCAADCARSAGWLEKEHPRRVSRTAESKKTRRQKYRANGPKARDRLGFPVIDAH